MNNELSSKDEAILFTASTRNIPHIYRVLKAISQAGKEATITISDQGLKVSVETSSKSCQAHLFLSSSLFSMYTFKPEIYTRSTNTDDSSETTNANDDDVSSIATLNISLRSLTGCLQIFSDSQENNTNGTNNKKNPNSNNEPIQTANEINIAGNCLFVYRGPGYPFMVYFNQGSNILTKCELDTYDRDGTLDLGEENNENNNDYDEDGGIVLDQNEIVQKIILKGSLMAEAMKELDAINTNVVTIKSSSHVAPHFTFISHGEVGVSEYTFPNEKSVLEVFLVTRPGGDDNNVDDNSMDIDDDANNIVVQNSYLFSLINLMHDAVNLATRVSIRCDSTGVMSIQSMCEWGNVQSFIDFRFLPIED